MIVALQSCISAKIYFVVFFVIVAVFVCRRVLKLSSLFGYWHTASSDAALSPPNLSGRFFNLSSLSGYSHNASSHAVPVSLNVSGRVFRLNSVSGYSRNASPDASLCPLSKSEQKRLQGTEGTAACPARFGWIERTAQSSKRRLPVVNAKYAVCAIRETLSQSSKEAFRFQHSIGFWYPCWSWFQLYPSAIPVVCDAYQDYKGGRGMASNNQVGATGTHRWTAGMVDIFKRAGVLFLPWPCKLGRSKEKAMREMHNNSRTYYFDINSYTKVPYDQKRRWWFVEPQHAAALARYAIGEQTIVWGGDARVGILDRAVVRGIKNIGEVFAETRRIWQNITVTYFENFTFMEQIRWYHNHDMVVSPHGAQCTLVPFMPPCGAFLEIHMKYRTQKPKVFGALAADSGLISGYLYLSTNDFRTDDTIAQKSEAMRIAVEKEFQASKNSRTCVPPQAVVKGLKALEKRRKCCVASR